MSGRRWLVLLTTLSLLAGLAFAQPPEGTQAVRIAQVGTVTQQFCMEHMSM